MKRGNKVRGEVKGERRSGRTAEEDDERGVGLSPEVTDPGLCALEGLVDGGGDVVDDAANGQEKMLER